MVGTSDFPRLLSAPEGSFFLFGPRGTGKTTWLRGALPSAHFVNLLDEALFQSYLADAGHFAGELRALPRGAHVVVDEVQRLPALLNEVQRFMEERSLRFALSGSSARKLKTPGTNLLAGRAVWLGMHPLVPEEMGDSFSLEEALRWGTLPIVWRAADRAATLQAYAQLYLQQEIQAEALVRNLPGFARFLPIAALFHGQTINVAGMARDAGVARMTAAGYLDLLEDTLLAYRLPAYEPRLRVRERKHPKLYWVDAGLPRALKRQMGPPSAEERGHLFEGWIAGLLRAYGDYRGLFDEWFYWAPSQASRVEVDFVLRRDDSLVALEAKASRRAGGDALRGLLALEKLPGLRRRILVYLGDRRLRTEHGIEVLPWQEVVAALEEGTLFP